MDKPSGMHVTAGGAADTEYWFLQPLGEGMVASYRLTYQGVGLKRRARIHELRIVTDSKGRPFSFKVIRRKITARFFQDGLAATNITIPSNDLGKLGNPVSRIEASSSTKAGRPPLHPPLFYAKFAKRYEQVEYRLRKEPRDSTRKILAKHYNVPITTIGKWIRVSRQKGYLSPTRRGSRGGQATKAAHEEIERSKKK